MLVGSKISLRSLTPDDAAGLAAIFGADSEAIQRTATIPDPCTEDAARAWITARLKPEAVMMAMVDQATGGFAGMIGLGPHGDSTELGYAVGRPFWNRGFASEAVELLLRHAASLGIGTVEAKTFPDNGASGRVLEKAGFLLTGTVMEDLPMRGGLREVLAWRMEL